MLKSILVGLDGSAYSTRAVELALRWGKQFDATIVGMGIIDKPGVDRVEAMPIGAAAFKRHTDEVQLKQAQAKVEKCLNQFTSRCMEQKVKYATLEEIGVPYEEILEESQKVDLLLLGQQTYFEFETYDTPGKTLHQVLKHSPRPVITVPKKLKEMDNIIIAYDASLQSAHALESFRGLNLHKLGEVHIVSIGEGKEKAAYHANIAVEYLKHHGVECTVHTPDSDDPADTLLKMIRKLKAGLVVMGAYGRSKLKEFFFGSVTKTMLKKSPVPLFLYH